MDAKLAKGFTRQGFRQDFRALDDVTDTQASVFKPYIEKITGRGD
ncbi:hypothetical protein ACFQY9_06780 [Microvirga aerilata]